MQTLTRDCRAPCTQCSWRRKGFAGVSSCLESVALGPEADARIRDVGVARPDNIAVHQSCGCRPPTLPFSLRSGRQIRLMTNSHKSQSEKLGQVCVLSMVVVVTLFNCALFVTSGW